MKKNIWILLLILLIVLSAFVWVYYLHSNEYQYKQCINNDLNANSIRNTHENIHLIDERCSVYYPNNYKLYQPNKGV